MASSSEPSPATTHLPGRWGGGRKKWSQGTKSSQGGAEEGSRVWALTFELLYGPHAGVIRPKQEAAQPWEGLEGMKGRHPRQAGDSRTLGGGTGMTEVTSQGPGVPWPGSGLVGRAGAAVVSEPRSSCARARTPGRQQGCLTPLLRAAGGSSPLPDTHLQSLSPPEQGPGHQQDGAQLSQSCPPSEVPLPGGREGGWGGAQAQTWYLNPPS